MSNNKLLAALCYFSVFFTPLLVPVIVYFVSDDREVKHHAKRSLVSHLVPVAGFIIFSFSMFSFTYSMNQMPSGNFGFWQLTPVLFMLVYGLLLIAILIWNVFQGVKVLK